MSKCRESFIAYFGAFGTVWTLLHDFGLDAEAALILVVFAVGVLVGLRLRAILARPRSPATAHRSARRRP